MNAHVPRRHLVVAVLDVFEGTLCLVSLVKNSTCNHRDLYTVARMAVRTPALAHPQHPPPGLRQSPAAADMCLPTL